MSILCCREMLVSEVTLFFLSGVLSAFSGPICPAGISHLVVQVITSPPCNSCDDIRVEVACVEGARPVSGLETAVIFCRSSGLWRHVPEMGCQCNKSLIPSPDGSICIDGPNQLGAVYYPRTPQGHCTPPLQYIGEFRFLAHEEGTFLLGSRGAMNIFNQANVDCIDSVLHSCPDCHFYYRVTEDLPMNSSLILACASSISRGVSCAIATYLNETVKGFVTYPAPDEFVSYHPEITSLGEFRRDRPGDPVFFSAAISSTGVVSISLYNVNFQNSRLLISKIAGVKDDSRWLNKPVRLVDYYRATYGKNLQYYFVFISERDASSDIELSVSRVVRICRANFHRSHILSTFQKARIFCENKSPIGREYVGSLNHQYNSINSMAFNDDGRFHENGNYKKMMYAAFSDSSLGPKGSAVCAYSAENTGYNNRDRGVFGIFYEGSSGSRRNVYFECKVGGRPQGQLDNVLVSKHVAQLGTHPIFMMEGVVFTRMAIDRVCVVKSTDHMQCVNQDILLLGTDKGKILKVVFATRGANFEPVVAEELSLFENSPVKDIVIIGSGESKALLAYTSSRVYRLPLERCSQFHTCRACIDSRDPYCVWNNPLKKCESSQSYLSAKNDGIGQVLSGFYQNIHTGHISLVTCGFCSVPDPPINGRLVDYSVPLILGDTVTYQCNKGFEPATLMTTICNSSQQFSPLPRLLKCIQVNITTENVLGGSICRGQKVVFKCSTNINSLMWVATIPGLKPISITHDSANFNNMFIAKFNITTILTRSTCSRDYTESLITFTLQSELMLECKIPNTTRTMQFSFSFSGKVPPPPAYFRVSQGVQIGDLVISTFEWNPPVNGIIDFYKISISPRPLSHPMSNLINASLTSWEVTLDANAIYTASIIASNCAGDSIEATATVANCGTRPDYGNNTFGSPKSSLTGATFGVHCTRGYISRSVMVTCNSDGHWEPSLQKFLVAPPSPSEVSLRTLRHSRDTTDVVITWNPPFTNASVDYFRVTVLPIPPSHPVAFNIIYSSSMIVVVQYNVEYRVTILGANCAAQTRPVSIPKLMIGGCDVPIPPMNGDIQNFTSREIGAQVTYVCYGNSTVTANCTISGKWFPSPLMSPCDPRDPNVAIIYISVTVVAFILVTLTLFGTCVGLQIRK